jgi:hypothetical protein
MNKPIVAHSFEEMNKLDGELVNDIPLQKRKAAWKAITELSADSTSAASQNQASKVKRKSRKRRSANYPGLLSKVCTVLSKYEVEYIIVGGTAVQY